MSLSQRPIVDYVAHSRSVGVIVSFSSKIYAELLSAVGVAAASRLVFVTTALKGAARDHDEEFLEQRSGGHRDYGVALKFCVGLPATCEGMW